MNSFFDLEKFPQFQIKASYDLFINLLDQIFGKDSYLKMIRIDKEVETEKNHQIILENWESIKLYYKTQIHIKKTKKLVRQTLKYIVKYLNETHHFEHPIKWNQKMNSYRIGNKTFTPTYVELMLS
jgi:hypothetical protein